MIESDAEYFLKESDNSSIKNTLRLIKGCLNNNIPRLADTLQPPSQAIFRQQLSPNKEKLQALHGIMEKLVMLDEQSLLLVETMFNENIKIASE
jgi:hypothetical protein